VIPQLLAERTILVTGGSRGIGAAVAAQCLEAGATVALMARGAGSLDATRSRLAERFGDRVFAFQGDVTQVDDVRRAVAAAAEIGRLAGLVNNAGGNTPTRLFVDLSREAFNHSIALNLIAYADSIREVLPHFVRSGKGAIVNVASMAGKIGVPAWTAYCAAKHGVLGLTKSLARELAREGIRCNAVCPGFVETEMMSPERMGEWADALGTSRRDLVKAVIYRDTPQGRYVDEASVGHATVYLLSDLAADITGQSLNVSCGIGDY
jgi:NAD(P)-dependent dehydrogenase (short-subunit alcohol dehydrogenase family)